MRILNECKYAEKCLSDGSVGDNLFETLSILARYFYHKKGYKQKDIESALISFVEDHYVGYTKKRTYINGFIEKISKSAKNGTLQEIDGLWVTQKELDTIRGIGDSSTERLVFAMLCHAKLNIARNPNSNGWVNDHMKEIFATARISAKDEDRANMIRNLRTLGLIEKGKKGKIGNYRVAFVDKDGQNELFIDDFRELGYEYLKYCGQNFIRCAECGVLTRGNKAGTKRYCSSCVAYTPMITKKVTCVDCGEEFEVNSKNNKSKRCFFCQRIYKREQNAELKRIARS